MAPIVTMPLPSGSGVTGMKSSWNRVSRPKTWSRFRRKMMIDSDVELILIDRLVVDAPVVVRGAGARRQRIVRRAARARPDRSDRQESCCPGTACGSRRRQVSGRSSLDRRWPERGADGLGEDALTLQQRRNGGDHGPADRLPLSLIVDEEERAVSANGPADNAAELVASKLRLAGRRSRRSCGRSTLRCRRNSNAVP